jgi:hypothetical protein
MGETIQTMERRLGKAVAEGAEAATAVIEEILERHGRETALAVLEERTRRADAEWAEKVAEHEAYTAHHNEIMRLFAVCPEGKTTSEVCRIMAERGDPFAQSMHAMFESREYRLEGALTDAAVELHPGWRADGDGTFTKLDPAAPEPPALVEWLYKNHPAQARAVEESFQ